MAEVRLEVELAHPPERVWRALTDARALAGWFMPTDLVPQVGNRFTLHPGTLPGFPGQLSGELTELIVPSRMVMLWQGDNLHTRVVWELAATAEGCRVQMVQTGFIGAPAALRRELLRGTYAELFAERLPPVLERLAVIEAGGPPTPPRPAAPPPSPVPPPPGTPAPSPSPGASAALAVPRQRRSRANMPAAVWAAGRTMAPRPNVRPAAYPDDHEQVSGHARRVHRSAHDVPSAGRGQGAGPGAGVPAWARSVAVGTATTLLVLAVLATVAYRPDSGMGGGDPDLGEAGPDAPGMAVQPGMVTSDPEPAAPPSGAPGDAPAASPSVTGPLPDTRAPPVLPTEPGQSPTSGPPPPTAPGPTPTPSPTPAPTAQLTASVSTAGLPLLGGRSVRVTVANGGPVAVEQWEVAMSVGDQTVTNVTDAWYQRDGSQAIFTPAGGELAAGESGEFEFHLRAPVLGLLGASDPTGCTIDGRPCD